DRRSSLLVAPEHLFRDARERLLPPGHVIALQQHLVDARHAGGHRRRDLLLGHCDLRSLVVALSCASAQRSGSGPWRRAGLWICINWVLRLSVWPRMAAAARSPSCPAMASAIAACWRVVA